MNRGGGKWKTAGKIAEEENAQIIAKSETGGEEEEDN